MIEYNNMNNEPQKSEQYFSSSLREAIISGDPLKVKEALEGQDANTVTEAISNRILVRSFLLKQKQQLSRVNEEVEGKTLTEGDTIVEVLREYLKNLDADFVDSFVAEDGHAETSKLSGDTYFRAALSEESDGTVQLARQLSTVDVSRLTSPKMVLDWAQHIRDSIVESVWDSAQDIREQGASEVASKSVHHSIEEAVNELDKYIAGSLPRQ